MYGDILPDELDHDWHCCQILHRSFYTDSSKKKKKKKEEKTWYLILKSDLKKLSKGSITVLCQIFLSN